MPDESWTLTDTIAGSEYQVLHEDKVLHDGLAHNETHPWTVGLPFSDTGVLTDSLVIGIPLHDTIAGREYPVIHEEKVLHDGLAVDDGASTWQNGWEFNERIACTDAITEFDRVIWKLTLGRW